MPWLLAVRRKKLRHLHPLLLLKLRPLLLLLRPLTLPSLLTLLLRLLTLQSRLKPLLLLTPPSRLKPLRQNNHQIIFKKPVSGPVFFRPQFVALAYPALRKLQ